MTEHCPICKNINYKDLFTVEGKEQRSFKVVKCLDCMHVFTLLPPGLNINSYYEDEDYRIVDVRKSIFFKLMKIEYSRILNVLKRINAKLNSLLDFGCGKGNFLWFAKNKRWNVFGVETSVPRAEYARKVFNLNISTEFYSGGKIGNTRYDVITLLHVLEHLPDPLNLLHELVRENLAEKGVLLIEVPNFNSIQSRLAKNKWIHLDVPRHISHFTEKTLTQILSIMNMTPIRRKSFSFHIGVLGMVQSILSFCGYRKNILTRLKYKKTISIIVLIMTVLPIALLLEAAASFFKRGGVLRIYAITNK